MSKLILSAAYGYGVDDLKPFVHSLRKHYDGEVLFLIKELSTDLKSFFEHYNIKHSLVTGLQKDNDIQWCRYMYYFHILTSFENVDRVFISDVRDVIFQDDPFKYSDTDYDLEFFEEPEIIRNCHCNGGWTLTLYGSDGLTKIGDKNIICSGTTMGSRIGMLNYFRIMNEQIENFFNNGYRVKGGEDQPIHFYSIYNNKFANFKIHHNCESSVATVSLQKEFTFNEFGRLVDGEMRVIPVVHQWDRLKQYYDNFLKIAME